MNKSKKIEIVSAALGTAVLAATPVVVSSCSLTTKHSYTVQGVTDAIISVNGSSSERTLNLIENGKTVTDDVVWSLDQTEGKHSRVSLKGNKYEVLGTSEGTDAFTFVGVCNGSKATATMNVTIEGEKDCYVTGNKEVNVRVGRTTNWIDLHLIDKQTEQEAAGTIMWSIYGTGTHAHAQRNSDEEHQNQYNITGEIFGNDTLKARAIRQKPDKTYVVYEFEIPVNVKHTYHVATDSSTAIDDVTVKYGSTTDAKTLKLLDEENNSAPNQQNVTYAIKGTAQKDHSTIALEGTNNNQYKITGNSFGQNDVHTVTATYEGDTFDSDVKVNVEHKYSIKGKGVTEAIHLKVGEKTDWIPLDLVDENGDEAIPKTGSIEWSISNLDNLTGGVERTTIKNLYRVTGIEHSATTKGASTNESGHYKLDVSANIDGEYIRDKIEVYVGHQYHIKFYDDTEAKALTTKYSKETAQQQFHLIDDEGNEVTDPTNVTYSIKSGEQAKGDNSTIKLVSGTDKYTVLGDKYGNDTHTIVATYKGDTYESILNVNVDHLYHVVGGDESTLNIELNVGQETGWKFLYLYDEEGKQAVPKESLTWSIYATDGLTNAVGRSSETTNAFNVSAPVGAASTEGTSTQEAGKFVFNARAVLDVTNITEFTINVKINHSYFIVQNGDIVVKSGSTTPEYEFKLNNDEQEQVKTDVSWKIERTTDTSYSTADLNTTTGKCTFTGTETLGTDGWKVTATYNDIPYEYEFNVTVCNYYISGISSSETVNVASLSSQVTRQMSLIDLATGQTVQSGIEWGIEHYSGQQRSVVTINSITGVLNAAASGLRFRSGDDVWKVTAKYNEITYELYITVHVTFA